ncbi:hypothetical protein [Kineosporia sp. A_224]|nr:hypothetical protein [Kineosporia sp. A_224]
MSRSGHTGSTCHSQSAVVPPSAAPSPAASTAAQTRVIGGTGPVNVA